MSTNKHHTALELEQRLKDKGIAPTAMRLLVFEFFLDQTSAQSLVDLERYFNHADRTTLYRTLKTFEEKGLIHSIEDGTEATRYALCAEGCRAGDHYDLHLHFYCYGCQRTICLPRHKVPEVTVPDHFALQELTLIAKGLCDACSQNNAIQLHGPTK
ncbi:Fur family transcriptional regulator [Flaviaesturariibacter amylovorans]|uniref:Transcriptional regulator n=1 Tax=Flaviaesturariibacter amylovorans TaxID=1084520 RepID=A0ABP8HBX3_9BACT